MRTLFTVRRACFKGTRRFSRRLPTVPKGPPVTTLLVYPIILGFLLYVVFLVKLGLQALFSILFPRTLFFLWQVPSSLTSP
jgi:hypothetical protein